MVTVALPRCSRRCFAVSKAFVAMRLDAFSVITRTAVAFLVPSGNRTTSSSFTYKHSVFSRKITMSMGLTASLFTTGRTLAYKSRSLRILTMGEEYPSTLTEGELTAPKIEASHLFLSASTVSSGREVPFFSNNSKPASNGM
eukprot:Lithocolla_globosa_v1_NODE_5986_length_1153_cov_12.128415.p2 type:complete len:142 gc:universal NODE_5986_length_1153_cov_12.128415:555-980(+)